MSIHQGLRHRSWESIGVGIYNLAVLVDPGSPGQRAISR